MSMMSDSDLGAPGQVSPPRLSMTRTLCMRWAAAAARVPACSVRLRSSRRIAPCCLTGEPKAGVLSCGAAGAAGRVGGRP